MVAASQLLQELNAAHRFGAEYLGFGVQGPFVVFIHQRRALGVKVHLAEGHFGVTRCLDFHLRLTVIASSNGLCAQLQRMLVHLARSVLAEVVLQILAALAMVLTVLKNIDCELIAEVLLNNI
jgi:hypothetical protein